MSGILSSIVINDIVCLLFTPVVIMICLKVKVNPIPYLLAVAMASNIGSACTFIGNPQNVLIGSLSQVPAENISYQQLQYLFRLNHALFSNII